MMPEVVGDASTPTRSADVLNTFDQRFRRTGSPVDDVNRSPPAPGSNSATCAERDSATDPASGIERFDAAVFTGRRSARLRCDKLPVDPYGSAEEGEPVEGESARFALPEPETGGGEHEPAIPRRHRVGDRMDLLDRQWHERGRGLLEATTRKYDSTYWLRTNSSRSSALPARRTSGRRPSGGSSRTPSDVPGYPVGSRGESRRSSPGCAGTSVSSRPSYQPTSAMTMFA